MSKSVLLRKIQAFALVMLIAGCGRKASDEIDFGTISNSIYTNKYFGMAITLPAGWNVQDQEAQRRLMTTGRNMLAGDDKNEAAVLKASELQTVNLFGVFKYPRGTPVDFNPAILAVAEKVSQLPGITRGKDYFFHARKLLESGQLKIDFPKDYYTKQLGGHDFDVMELEISVRGATVKEAYYTTIIKGYALSFIVSFTNDQERQLAEKVLESLTFHQ